jgi:hypothetical protein
MRQLLALSLALAALFVSAGVRAAGDGFSGSTQLEARFFPQTPSLPSQYERYGLSLALLPEYSNSWAGGQHKLTFQPFVRLDQRDTARSHVDVRELSWSAALGDLELKLGVARVFWGVLESRHVVDIINQTDNLENVDGEDKLGQPMLSLSYLAGDLGTLDLMLMTGFRVRRFPGAKSRLRLPLPVDTAAASFGSKLKRWAPDVAVRWSQRAGPFDLGLAYFYGTSREPQLRIGVDAATASPVLIPHYDRIHQASIDWQATLGGLLLKLEAFGRFGQGRAFGAASGGFEYTLNGLIGSADLGLLAEYHADNRTNLAPNFLDHDLFSGLRLALNDVDDTSVLAGATVDVKNSATFINVEASRRWGETRKLGLQARVFVSDHEPQDLLYLFRRDSYLELSAEWFF